MLLLLALSACTPLISDITTPVGLRESAQYHKSDGDGLVSVEVVIEEGDRSFHLTADSAALIGVEGVYAPNGEEVLWWEDWWGSSENLTSAFEPSGPCPFDWPIRRQDGPLTPGVWTVDFGVVDYEYRYRADVDVDVQVYQRADDRINQGEVSVRVLYAGGAEGDPDVTAAVESAVEIWQGLWGRHGVSLEVEFGVIASGAQLAPPMGSGVAAYEDASEASGPGVITMVIGEGIAGVGALGISGGIPGALAATRVSVVLVSWLDHAGPNGTFVEREIQTMAETMAHETGHYMGLFHPVESDFSQWDALDDTEQCGRRRACEDTLGGNNLFPYPVCSSGISCELQEHLTEDQIAVINRYTGTR